MRDCMGIYCISHARLVDDHQFPKDLQALDVDEGDLTVEKLDVESITTQFLDEGVDTCCNISLGENDFQRLTPPSWLNCRIMDAFIGKIASISTENVSIHCLCPTFSAQLLWRRTQNQPRSSSASNKQLEMAYRSFCNGKDFYPYKRWRIALGNYRREDADNASPLWRVNVRAIVRGETAYSPFLISQDRSEIILFIRSCRMTSNLHLFP